MAKNEKIGKIEALVDEKVIEEIAAPEKTREEIARAEIVEAWRPKTKLGEEVKSWKIKNIDEILNKGRVILEEQIVDSLINTKSDLLSIGQSKGKFGGGKRRAWKQTQRKTMEGNNPSFTTAVVVGDERTYESVAAIRAVTSQDAMTADWAKALNQSQNWSVGQR